MQSFYVDTCIYLNLWKKEVDEKGNPLWFYAREFFEKSGKSGAIIYYSGFLLKELMFTLSTDEYLRKRELFESSKRFKKIILSKEEYKLAQKFKENNKNISFLDIIHMISSRKTKSILITRDKDLMNLSKTFFVEAKKPEEVL